MRDGLDLLRLILRSSIGLSGFILLVLVSEPLLQFLAGLFPNSVRVVELTEIGVEGIIDGSVVQSGFFSRQGGCKNSNRTCSADLPTLVFVDNLLALADRCSLRNREFSWLAMR